MCTTTHLCECERERASERSEGIYITSYIVVSFEELRRRNGDVTTWLQVDSRPWKSKLVLKRFAGWTSSGPALGSLRFNPVSLFLSFRSRSVFCSKEGPGLPRCLRLCRFLFQHVWILQQLQPQAVWGRCRSHEATADDFHQLQPRTQLLLDLSYG